MGVIKQFDIGRTPPIFRSSEESLPSIGLSVPSTPPSEAEDIHPTEQRRNNLNPRRRDPALLIQRLEQISRKRTGARRARREENLQNLQTLAESDGESELHTPSIHDFMPCSKSALTKIMTDFNCMMVWQYFLSLSEEEQKKYLNDVDEARKKKEEASGFGLHFTQTQTQDQEGQGADGESEKTKLSPEQRFRRVDSGLRKSLKKGAPMGMLSFIENEVIDVFSKDSGAIYVSPEMSSYERLLLHGVSQYHLLKSWSIDIAQSRRTKVENRDLLFSSPETTLTQFLERRRPVVH